MNTVKKIDDIRVLHFDTAAAEGLADAVFVVGSVNIDVAQVGITMRAFVFTGLKSAQSYDTTGNEVTLLFTCIEFGKMFYWLTSLKNHAIRFVRSYLICQCM